MTRVKYTKLSEKKYYDYMCEMGECIANESFEELHSRWFNCFAYSLRKLDPSIPLTTIRALFYDWDMDNWEALHQDKTEYAGMEYGALLDSFDGECNYICDRVSWDRIFRVHWLFKRAFNKRL